MLCVGKGSGPSWPWYRPSRGGVLQHVKVTEDLLSEALLTVGKRSTIKYIAASFLQQTGVDELQITF